MDFDLYKSLLCTRDFWETCACPEKQSVPWIHCVEDRPIFFIIQNFEQLPLAVKNRVCPKIFYCIEIFFIMQDFWASCACPENRACPEFSKPGDRPPTLRLVRHWSHCRWHAGCREIDCTTRAHQHRLWQTAQCDSHPERGSISRRCLPSWLSPNKIYTNSDVFWL